MTIFIIVSCLFLTAIVFQESRQDARLKKLEKRASELEEMGILLMKERIDRFLKSLEQDMKPAAPVEKKPTKGKK